MQQFRTWLRTWLRTGGAAVQQSKGRHKLAAAAMALLCIALTMLSALAETGAQAQSGPPALHTHSGHQMLLPGSVPKALGKAKRVGKQDTGTKLQLIVTSQFSDPNGLAALIASQNDPKSSQYHKYLTAQDFINRFSPSQQSVDAVRTFLTKSGLKVTSVSPNRTLIDATGTVAQAERAFGVTIGHYQLGKRDVYGPDAPPRIPDTLAATVIGIGGLDNVAQVRPLLSRASSSADTRQTALGPRAEQHPQQPSSGPGGGFTPSDLRGAYNVASLISAGGDGTGQRVAVFELAPYIVNDISAYRSNYGLPSATINNISVDGAATTCTAGASCDNGSGIGEADLDIEVVSALAPNATQDIYVGPNTWQALIDTYNKIVSDDKDRVMTTSWGLCEPDEGTSIMQSVDNIFAQGASQGQTFFAAAGDSGSDDCATGTSSGISPSGRPPSVDSPAGDPFVLGVGGTSLTLSGSSYGSESVWNRYGVYGGGGGISGYFTQPSYQVGAGVLNSYSTGEREVPDVTADADPYTGYSVYCSSTAECGGRGWVVFGGTSAAAPLWAGLTAGTFTYLSNHSVSLPGWLNPMIYTLFSNNQTYAPYQDVTSGNNDDDYSGSSYAGDYPATTCYDLASGVGSPNAYNIARDIQGGVKTAGNGPCPNPLSGTQLLQDGGFEQPSGSSPWNQFSVQGEPVILSSAYAHSGAASFFPCGYANCDDRVSQTVAVPATVNGAHLLFWLETFSDFPYAYANPPCLDHVYATLSTVDGTPVANGSLLASCPTSATYGYQLESFDVTSLLQAHEGQQLVLTFRGATGGEAPYGYYTSWSIDDASLTYS